MRKLVLIAIFCGCGAFCDSGAGQQKECVLDLGDGVLLKLVRIPAGKFLMGSPAEEKIRDKNRIPQREVTISKDFYLGRCEITRGQFAAFVKDAEYETDAEREGWAFAWGEKKWGKIDGASWKSAGFDQTDDHPAVCISSGDAAAFCKWLGEKTVKTVRLPTEAEWEYACRAGSTAAYCWGSDPADGKGFCNVADKTGKAKFRPWRILDFEDGYIFTAPVGSFRPNEFGLHDMHGNVWEWCSDFYRKECTDKAAVDPQGPCCGELRVVRGGSWLSSSHRCRCEFRCGIPPSGSCCDAIVGFRVVVETAIPACQSSGESVE